MKPDYYSNDLEGAAEYERLRSALEDDNEQECDCDADCVVDDDEDDCNCSDPECPCSGNKRY